MAELALGIGAFCLFVVCSGAGFWGLGKLVNLGFAGAGTKGSLIYSWESPDERHANIAAAMNASSPGCSAAELRELTRFYDGVLDALGQADHGAFRKLVDRNAFAHRASLHPAAVASGEFDQGSLESQLEYDLEGPRGWSRFTIVRVARGQAANEALVYGVCTGDGKSATPFRWWLRRSGRSWTICDWEMIERDDSEAVAGPARSRLKAIPIAASTGRPRPPSSALSMKTRPSALPLPPRSSAMPRRSSFPRRSTT